MAKADGMGNYFLGIDAGTTLIKTVLFDESGSQVCGASSENRIYYTEEGGAEIDLELYWKELSGSINKVMKVSGVGRDDVKALAVSAHGVTVVPVDSSGIPLRRAFSYLDKRGTREARELIDVFGRRQLFANTGQPNILPVLIPVKVLWMKYHEPEVFNTFYKLVTVDAYLAYKFTGLWVATPSISATTGFIKLENGDFWCESMEYMGITPERLGKVKQSGTPIGTLHPKVAKNLGLSEKTLVVCGALDQAAGCVGTGNLTEGVITESTGTVLAISATVDEPRIDDDRPAPCFAHAVPQKFIMLPYCLSGGSVLKWFRDEFYEGVDYASIVGSAEGVRAGSDNLLMLPHLTGADSPEYNSNARGVFYNIDLRHTRAHFIRALLEGIGYMLRRNMELLRSLGLAVDNIRCIGGGSRSKLWNQIKADITGISVATFETEEVAALGAALLASVGCGFFTSIEEGCRRFVRIKETFVPNENNAHVYDECYERYVELYRRLEPMFTEKTSS